MTRSPKMAAYDDDFFAWTQEQAAALRHLPASVVGEDVDVAKVAVEIEDLGRRDLRDVRANLKRMIEHLIKIDGLSPVGRRPALAVRNPDVSRLRRGCFLTRHAAAAG